jgi:hypothetical protein
MTNSAFVAGLLQGRKRFSGASSLSLRNASGAWKVDHTGDLLIGCGQVETPLALEEPDANRGSERLPVCYPHIVSLPKELDYGKVSSGIHGLCSGF